MYLEIIHAALRKLWCNDRILIDKKVKEECINHRLAIYIERELFSQKNNYSVDLEYDKNLVNDKNSVSLKKIRKKIISEEGNERPIRPDIIVHERGHNRRNLIAIECKKGYLDKNDKYKLQQLSEEPYCYNFTVGISYQPEKCYFILYRYENGVCKREKIDKGTL